MPRCTEIALVVWSSPHKSPHSFCWKRGLFAERSDRKKEFRELLKYTGTGFVGGLVLGALLDSLGFQRSAVGQWVVRTLTGEGESLLEGIYALRQHLKGVDH